MTWHDMTYITYMTDIHTWHTLHTLHTWQTVHTVHTWHTGHTWHTLQTLQTHCISWGFNPWHDTTWHDFTSHPDLWQLRAWEGEGDRGEKKKQSCAHSCCQRSLTPIQAHALPSACRAESCLLCCQPEPSLSRYLPDYHELLHDSLADCKLKGDEPST